jgi:hypothetical protein
VIKRNLECFFFFKTFKRQRNDTTMHHHKFFFGVLREILNENAQVRREAKKFLKGYREGKKNKIVYCSSNKVARHCFKTLKCPPWFFSSRFHK